MSKDRYNGGVGPTGGNDPAEVEPAPFTPAIDTVFEVLENEYRRRICLFLIEEGVSVVRLEDVANALEGELDEVDPGRFRAGLHHWHLPKLDAVDLVDYDPRSRTIRYRGQPTVEKWAEHIDATVDR